MDIWSGPSPVEDRKVRVQVLELLGRTHFREVEVVVAQRVLAKFGIVVNWCKIDRCALVT